MTKQLLKRADLLEWLVLSGASYVDAKDLEVKPAGSY